MRSSFESAGDRSPILMNAAILEAIDALEADDSPDAIAALRAQIEAAIDWYTAGRGC